MLYYALVFLILGLVASAQGAYGVSTTVPNNPIVE